MSESRAKVVSSFTIIKGSLIDETYSVLSQWDFGLSRRENLQRIRETNSVGAGSVHWLRDISKVLNRRYDPNGRDRPLAELAKAGVSRDVWTPILLWHMTRDEFLVRDFLIHWLYPQFTAGVFRLRTDELLPYLAKLPDKGEASAGEWTEPTRTRVAAGLMRMAVDFGLLEGKVAREFRSYHLPEEAFLYLLHAVHDAESNAHRLVRSNEWRMYLMAPEDVERELFRLHQFKKLRYEVAGSIAELSLPCSSAAEYAQRLCQ